MFGSALKSLFKSGTRELREKFSDDEEEFATPLGLRMGAAVDIDTLPLRMHADELHIPIPDESIVIAAQGYVELGDGTYAHRYYTADDVMVQVLTVNGMADEHVQEITLFVPFKSHYPSDEAQWSQWKKRIGQPEFTLDDGTVYERIWFDETDGFADPAAFYEWVYEDPESDEYDEIYHQAMLYGRNLEKERKNEYLLVSTESYGNEKTVELMIGVDLELAMIRVI